MAEGSFQWKALFGKKERKISTFNKKYEVGPFLSCRLVMINLPSK